VGLRYSVDRTCAKLGECAARNGAVTIKTNDSTVVIGFVTLEIAVVEVDDGFGHGDHRGKLGFKVLGQRPHAENAIFHNEAARMNKRDGVGIWLNLEFSDLLLAGLHNVLRLVRGILLKTRHHVVSRMHENYFLEDHGLACIQNYIDDGPFIADDIDFLVLIHLLKDESLLEDGLS
jgi:hypothetical protein